MENADDEIDCNRCCTCFDLFSDDVGTEREWLKCHCGRWIHEEYVDEDDINSSATKLCPLFLKIHAFIQCLNFISL